MLIKRSALFLQNNWLLCFGLILAFLIFGLFVFNSLPINLVKADQATSSVSVGNASPTVSSVTLVGGNVNLNEGTFKWASTTFTVTDPNGCTDISSVAVKFYRTSTSTSGTTCAQDDNNCYVGAGCTATTTGNTCDGSADPAAQYDCGFKIWYIADPTDSGTYGSNIWAVAATATDASAANHTATNAGELIEVVSLNALNVSATINYGSMTAGQNSGTSNQSVGATTTGNTQIDAEVGGSRYMCTTFGPGCSGNTVDVWNQKYDLSSVTYTSLTYYLTSTSTPVLNITNAKPTSTTTDQADIIYWGLNVPGGTPTGSYTGTTTFTAVSG